jgi:hypothetical protein
MSYELQVQSEAGEWECKLTCSTQGLATCHIDLYEGLYRRPVRIINTTKNITIYPKVDTKEQKDAQICGQVSQGTDASNTEGAQKCAT